MKHNPLFAYPPLAIMPHFISTYWQDSPKEALTNTGMHSDKSEESLSAGGASFFPKEALTNTGVSHQVDERSLSDGGASFTLIYNSLAVQSSGQGVPFYRDTSYI